MLSTTQTISASWKRGEDLGKGILPLNHWIRERFGLKEPQRPPSSTLWTPFTKPDCSELQPSWPWAPSGMRNPQLLWWRTDGKKCKKGWRNGKNGFMPKNHSFWLHLYWTSAPKKGRYKKWDAVMTFISSGDNYKSGCKFSSACWTEFIIEEATALLSGFDWGMSHLRKCSCTGTNHTFQNRSPGILFIFWGLRPSKTPQCFVWNVTQIRLFFS